MLLSILHSHRSLALFFASAATFTALLLGGCGNGPLALPSGGNLASVGGVVHGGQSPIQGATVKVYRTDPTATTYGAPGILIGTAISDVNGSFIIASPDFSGTGSSANPSNCPAGAQAYITAAGGYQSGQPSLVNNNMLMMAALGDCSTASAATTVIINEVTTVAAAYALSGFLTTSLDGSNSFYTVNVSAPAANSTSMGAITGSTPAGLAHAFMNAAHLVNTAAGMPNTTSALSSAGSTVNGLVPYTEILTLADAMQSCVDSGSGRAGSVSGISLTNGGSGYGVTATVVSGLSTAAGAKVNAILSSSGAVSGLQIVNGGAGYTPKITIGNAGNGSSGALTALLNGGTSAGVVSSVTIESGGSNYGPTVAISNTGTGTGTGATAYAIVGSGGAITSYVIVNGGSGYTNGSVSATVGANGTTGSGAVPGTITATGGKITAIAVGTAGTGYGPTITFQSPVSGTAAVGYPTITNGAITAVTISNAGTNYGPLVTFSAPASGTTAKGTLYAGGGSITSGVVSTTGSGYAAPAVTVSAPSVSGGTQATAVATTNGGSITGISITNAGSGYASAPAIAISPSPSGTTATATAMVNTDTNGDSLAPSTACNMLFALTPSLSGVRPVNTLQAFANLARNPYPSSAAVSNSSGLLSLISADPAFQPTLTTSPTDWSLSIVYTSGIEAPYWLGLDMYDTVYVGASTVTSGQALVGGSAYGEIVPSFGATGTATATRGVAADALGNIWVSTFTASPNLFRFSAASGGNGVPYAGSLSFGDGIAVDLANNVWEGFAIAGSTNLQEYLCTPDGLGGCASWSNTASDAASVTFPAGPYGVTIDANQNIWPGTYYTSGASGNASEAAVLANTGTIANPSYTALPITAPLSGGANHPYGAVMDASGNAWFGIYGGGSAITSGLLKIVPDSPNGPASLTPQNFLTGDTAGPNGNVLGNGVVNLPAIDGAGTIFMPDNSSQTEGLHLYSTVTGNVLSPQNGIKSCLLTSPSATVCGTNSAAAIYNPRQPAVDSTGSVWAGITTGGFTQLIGIAAPAYPLLSAGKPGLSPGLTASNPLP